MKVLIYVQDVMVSVEPRACYSRISLSESFYITNNADYDEISIIQVSHHNLMKHTRRSLSSDFL
jgi:hypothetical protein